MPNQNVGGVYVHSPFSLRRKTSLLFLENTRDHRSGEQCRKKTHRAKLDHPPAMLLHWHSTQTGCTNCLRGGGAGGGGPGGGRSPSMSSSIMLSHHSAKTATTIIIDKKILQLAELEGVPDSQTTGTHSSRKITAPRCTE